MKSVVVAALLVLPLIWRVQAAVDCNKVGEGYFADPDDTTCKNYIRCVYDRSSRSYSSSNYVCQNNRRFNPSTSSCTSNYVCPLTTTTSTTTTTRRTTTRSTSPSTTSTSTTPRTTTSSTTPSTTTSTTPRTTTSSITPSTTTTSTTLSTTTTDSPKSSWCTADGFYANPSSTNCTEFIECIDIDGTFIETNYTCPNQSYFDPETTLCVYDYDCPTDFKCKTAGRYTNNSDMTCQTYYFCVLLNDGTYVQSLYTCPSGSVFSSTNKVCTTSYTCTAV